MNSRPCQYLDQVLAKEEFSDMILQKIRLKSNLPEDEILSKAREREAQFKAIPGLLQK